MNDFFIGEIKTFAGNFAPKNFALANGGIINIASNTALFSLFGTTYGGNGTTTFGLPNLNYRVVIGAGSGQGLTIRTLGAQVGQTDVTLSTNEMPAHTHALTVNPSFRINNSNGSQDTPAEGACMANTVVAGLTLNAYNMASPDVTLATPTVTATLAVTNGAPKGSGTPHNNLQPYLGITYIVCLYGIFPPRS